MMTRNGSAKIGGCVVAVVAAIASCSFPTYDITVTGGSTAASGSSGSSGSAGGSGGASNTAAPAKSGCACSTTPTSNDAAPVALALGALAMMLGRRRR